jgi:hypothetical protein
MPLPRAESVTKTGRVQALAPLCQNTLVTKSRGAENFFSLKSFTGFYWESRHRNVDNSDLINIRKMS